MDDVSEHGSGTFLGFRAKIGYPKAQRALNHIDSSIKSRIFAK